MIQNYETLFETTIRSFLGPKASHIAGHAHDERIRKKWFRKVLKKVTKEIQDIETNAMHKERLAYWSECSLNVLKARKFDEAVLTLCILKLLAVLLGFVTVGPRRIATPAYFQTPSQHCTVQIMNDDDSRQDDHESSVAARKRLIDQLRSEGKTNFETAKILSISEYQVKKLRKKL